MDTEKEDNSFLTTLRKDGRLTVPKDLRDIRGWKRGDKLHILKIRKVERGEVE